MAIKFHQKYPERSNAPSTEYPSGSFRNRSDASAHDGTFLDETWANDKYGFFVKLLKEAGIEPDGTVDNAVKSQYFDALKAIIANETGMKELTGTSVNDVQTDGTYKIGKDVTGLPFDATSLIVAGKTGQIAISKDKMAFRVIGGQWIDVGDVDLSEYRKLDDNVFTGQVVSKATGDVGTGYFLICPDGNIRGQMIYNNYGLQFSQVQADGSAQTFTFPRHGDGGEILTAGNLVQTTGDSTTDAMSQKAFTDELKNHGLGYGQKWVDVKSQRAKDTQYLNETGKPIIVVVSLVAYSSIAEAYVNDLLIATISKDGSTSIRTPFVLTIPNGSSYKIKGGSLINNWSELRGD